jgi:hypothetical protein
VIQVAILGTPTSDLSYIDIPTLRFGLTGHDVPPEHFLFDDIDGDGDQDLLVFFSANNSNIECDTLFTYVTGKFVGGELFAGTDSVHVVGCH